MCYLPDGRLMPGEIYVTGRSKSSSIWMRLPLGKTLFGFSSEKLSNSLKLLKFLRISLEEIRYRKSSLAFPPHRKTRLLDPLVQIHSFSIIFPRLLGPLAQKQQKNGKCAF